jgi:transposase
MICPARPPGNRCEPCFAQPRWTKESPPWRALDEELPESHPTRWLVLAMERMINLEPLFASYSAGGSDALRPDLMLKIVLIEVWSGRQRPSQWFRDTQENMVLQWAGFGLRPSRSSWYNFRDRLGPFLDGWFRELLDRARAEGITSGERGSLDGTLIGANASRHRLLNEEHLERRREELQRAEAGDQNGEWVEQVPAWMAKTPARRIEQAQRYERAQARLQQFQAINARQNPARRRPRAKVVVSATDPESALGPDKEKVFRPLYNLQLMRDLDSPLSLTYEVFAQHTDGGTLRPMLRRAREEMNVPLAELDCDASYVTGCNLALCDQEKVTLYGPWQENDYSGRRGNRPERMIPKAQFTWLPEESQYRCPEGHPLKWIGREKRIQADGEINVMHRYRCSAEHCCGCGRQTQCTKNPARGRAVKRSEHEELIAAHRARMETEEAKAVYRLRKQTVELGYADLKQNRQLRSFSGRGLARVRIEAGLNELTRNLLIVESELRKHGTPNRTPENGYHDTS